MNILPPIYQEGSHRFCLHYEVMKVARLFDSRSSPREAGCGASSEVMARVDMQRNPGDRGDRVGRGGLAGSIQRRHSLCHTCIVYT